ncbi:DNA primase small subunit-like isoform X1 [Argonauta hians]
MPTKSSYDPEILPDLLPTYYKHLFPFNPYCTWLRYGIPQKSYFSLREFSFTLKDDVYVRYQSFTDQKDLETEICQTCPYKIDIGAVFSYMPKNRRAIKADNFVAEEKELVFDIDMTDYDDVRKCCSGAKICKKCWPLMVIAIRILDQALRDDFGFEHLLWIYSGRRGVHCWVCDTAARKLSCSGRSAVAEYLNIVKGGENNIKKVVLQEPIHPSIERSIEIVEEYFESYALVDQDILSDDNIKEVLSLIPDKNNTEDLHKFLLSSSKNSISRWRALTRELEKPGVHAGRVLKEIMLQYCYPRLDINVSKGINHLLKSPFSVHPKTGRVCVPIDVSELEDFDPFSVPTISQLIEEINTTSDEQNLKIKDYKKTSLKGSVELFESFVKKLKKTWEGAMIRESDLRMEV